MVGCGCDTFANQHRVGSGAGIILKFHRSEHSRFRYADHIVRQIGGTVYPVYGYFSPEARETAGEKIGRLLTRSAEKKNAWKP